MFKTITIATFIVILTTVLSAKDSEIILGKGYENDVWYSLENGIVKTEPKDNWDIGVQTGAKDAGIIINSQKGITLWVVDGSDSESWNNIIDTTGMTSNWLSGNNSTQTWAIGAFNLDLDGFETGGDFGWGLYDMASHSVSGSKVFVIKLNSDTYKKIMIESLFGGIYTIKWANFDGTDEQTIEINKNDYNNKMFIYLDIIGNQIVDREPDANSWALLFGKYTAMLASGDKVVPCSVTGVRTNSNYRTAVVSEVPVSSSKAPELNQENYSTNIANIGYEWKELDNQTMRYKIVDNLTFFITNEADAASAPTIHKIVFKEFEGSATGKLVFGLDDETNYISEINGIEPIVAPNIAESNSFVNIDLSNFNPNSKIRIRVYDQNGGELIKRDVNPVQSGKGYNLQLPSVSVGLYFVSIDDGNKKYFEKLIIK